MRRNDQSFNPLTQVQFSIQGKSAINLRWSVAVFVQEVVRELFGSCPLMFIPC